MSQLSSRLDPTLSARIEELVASLEQEHDGLASAIQRIETQFPTGTNADTLPELTEIVRTLRDELFVERADNLRRYVGLQEASPAERITNVSQKLVQQAQTPEDLARPGIAAVFTAHPTFALADDVYAHLAQCATSPKQTVEQFATHRREKPPTLSHEQGLALDAILRGRDALDEFTASLLKAMHERWGTDAVSAVDPSPIILASWVGFDTDGRTDIGWWDTLRIRLELKLAQLSRLDGSLTALSLEHSALAMRVRRAMRALSKSSTLPSR